MKVMQTSSDMPRQVARLFAKAVCASLAALIVFMLGCATTRSGSGTPTQGQAGSARPALRPGLAAPAGGTSEDSGSIATEGDTFTGVAARAAVVLMAEVPTGVLDPRTLDFASRGKGRIPSPISDEEAERLRQEALTREPDPMVQWVRPIDPRLPTEQQAAPVAAAVSFESLDFTECCGGGGGNVPPDPELAVGPGHIIAVVNVAFEIYDKTGAVLFGPTTFASLFSSVPGCSGVFDPNVLYDESADRFILAIDGDGDRYCIAASQSSNPLGAWNLYALQTVSSPQFFDFPHAGVGVDAIYVGANIFSSPAGSFVESRVYAIDKAALYAGSATTIVSHSTGAANSTPQPMNLHGFDQGTWPASGPHYILTERYDGDIHTVWAWDDPFGANTFGEVASDGDLNLNAATGMVAGFPVNAVQAGGGSIQANDWRGLDTEYRNGRIWMTNSISCNPGGGTVDCVRWAEIDPAVPSVIQAGVFASVGEYRIFPDLAVDHCDNMTIGYTKASSSTFPSVWATGREAGDSAGTISGTATQLKAGEVTPGLSPRPGSKKPAARSPPDRMSSVRRATSPFAPARSSCVTASRPSGLLAPSSCPDPEPGGSGARSDLLAHRSQKPCSTHADLTVPGRWMRSAPRDFHRSQSH